MTGFRGVRWVSVVLVMCGLVAFVVACQTRSEKAPPAGSPPADSAQTVVNEQGQQAYLAYCAMCHGPWGEGNGPLAVDLNQEAGVVPAHLNNAARLAQLGRPEIVKIITLGGGKTHRSNLMPPWGSKISATLIGQIADFVMQLPDLKPGVPRATIEKYLSAPPGTPEEGRKLFVVYCTMCHGPFGRGDGFLADTVWARNKVRPRNLTDSVYIAGKTDQALYETVALGGAYTGHSAVMPGWSVTLTPAQIKNVLSYVRSISHTASRP